MIGIIIIAITVIAFAIWILLAFSHIKYLKAKRTLKDSEKESKPEDPREEPDIRRVGPLLDFYSDRAVAHASFLVASIFGLFTLLTIIQQLDVHLMLLSVPLFWWSVPIFFVFSYLGYYTLLRFGFYARIAQKLSDHGLEFDKTFCTIHYGKKTLADYHKEQTEQQKLLILRKIIGTEKGMLALGIFYWVLVFFLGLIVYSRFWISPLDFALWFGVLVALIVIFAGIPAIHVYLSVKTKKKET